MQMVMNIARVLLATLIVAGLMVASFFVFMLLLGVAVVVGSMIWFKRQGILRPRKEWGSKGQNIQGDTFEPNMEQEKVTIIEGEAEEVKPAKDSAKG